MCPDSNTGPNVHSHAIGPAVGNMILQALRLVEPTFRIQINELDLRYPPSISRGHDDWFYVDVDVDGRVQRTSIVGKHKLPWKDSFIFDARQSSVITMRVFAQRMLHKDAYVGSVQGGLGAFLGSSGKAVLHEVSLSHSNNGHHYPVSKTKFSFSVKRVGEVDEPGFHNVTSGSPASLAAIVALFPNDGRIQQILESANTFSPLLDKINIFLTFTNALGDIHAYVKMAAVILTGVIKVFTSQMVLYSNIKNLVETMADAYSFLSESDPLSRIQSHRQIIRALSLQTVECSYFLRDVTKGGFGRFIGRLLTNGERKFQEYTQRYRKLKAALQERAIISTAVTVLRLYDEVKEISAQISLDNIPYAEDVHYTDVDECDSLKPRQRELSDEIARWINDDDSTERIFYICGPAGCGKTTVAREVARLFDGLQRLGSSYFVRESQNPSRQYYQSHHNDSRHPSCIFRNISRDIADHNPHFKQAVGQKVKKRAIGTTNRVRKQFQEFILEPATQTGWYGPVVIVIDALDACGKGQERKDLLNVLATKAAELPPNFRILVTSRPEGDVAHAFKDKSHVIMKILGGATLPDNDLGVSSPPVATSCRRHSPSPAGDSVVEAVYLEDENLTEHNEVYRSFEFFDEQDIYPYAGDTSPPPPYVHEDATPGNQNYTPVLHTKEQADLYLYDTSNPLKSVGSKLCVPVVHGHHVDGDVQFRAYPGELAEAEHLEDDVDEYMQIQCAGKERAPRPGR